MSILSSEPGNYPDRFPLPDNTLTFATDLIDEYGERFPNRASLMQGAVHTLNRYTGMIELGSTDGALLDSYETGETAIGGEISFRLRKPDPELDDDTGTIWIGADTLELKSFLEGVYRLVGARMLRNDRENTLESAGRVVSKGEYFGQPVWLVERFKNTNPDVQGFRTLTLKLVPEAVAEEQARLLSERQKVKFHNITRLGYDAIARLEAGGEINHENYLSYAKDLRSLKRADRLRRIIKFFEFGDEAARDSARRH